jgi:hypothetical protein
VEDKLLLQLRCLLVDKQVETRAVEVDCASSGCGVSKVPHLLCILYSHKYSFKMCCCILQLYVLEVVCARSIRAVCICVVFS